MALDAPASPSGANPPNDDDGHEGYGMARPVADPRPWRPRRRGSARERPGEQVTRVVSPTISVGQRLREIWLSRELAGLPGPHRDQSEVQELRLGPGLVHDRPGHDAGHLLLRLPGRAGQQNAEFHHLPLCGPFGVESLFTRVSSRARGSSSTTPGSSRRFPSPGRSWRWRRWDRPSSSSASSPPSWSSSWWFCMCRLTSPTSRSWSWPSSPPSSSPRRSRSAVLDQRVPPRHAASHRGCPHRVVLGLPDCVRLPTEYWAEAGSEGSDVGVLPQPDDAVGHELSALLCARPPTPRPKA